MAASLDKLVTNLPKDDFGDLKKHYTGEKFNLLTRKGVYPYEYMDSLEKLKETKLPRKEKIYSRLNGEDISDEDYQHTIKVWETFEMKIPQPDGRSDDPIQQHNRFSCLPEDMEDDNYNVDEKSKQGKITRLPTQK